MRLLQPKWQNTWAACTQSIHWFLFHVLPQRWLAGPLLPVYHQHSKRPSLLVPVLVIVMSFNNPVTASWSSRPSLNSQPGGYTTVHYCFPDKDALCLGGTVEPTVNMCHSRTTTPSSAPPNTPLHCSSCLHSTGSVCSMQEGQVTVVIALSAVQGVITFPIQPAVKGFACLALPGLLTVVPARQPAHGVLAGPAAPLRGLARPCAAGGLVSSPDCVGLHDPMDRSSPFSPLQAVMQTFLLHSAGGHLSPSGSLS